LEEQTAACDELRPSGISNPPEAEMKKCGIASGFAFGYDPTGRSVFFKNNNDRIPYFDKGGKNETSNINPIRSIPDNADGACRPGFHHR
jgi:hypothetical protein